MEPPSPNAGGGCTHGGVGRVQFIEAESRRWHQGLGVGGTGSGCLAGTESPFYRTKVILEVTVAKPHRNSNSAPQSANLHSVKMADFMLCVL